MKLRWLALALALVGCNLFINVPKEAQGDLQIDLVNSLDADVCDFSMQLQGTNTHENWLKHDLGPGSDRQFKIKPGAYKIDVGCGATFHGSQSINVTSAFTLQVGLPGTPATRYPTVLVPVTGKVGRYIPPAAAPQGPAGEQPAQSDQPATTDCLPDGARVSGTQQCCNKERSRSDGGEECYSTR